MTWKRVMIDGAPVAPFVGTGRDTFGTEKLREELEAENERVKILIAVRYLGRPADVRTRYKEPTIVAPSVAFAVMGGDLQSPSRGGQRLLGRRYDVEAFVEVRPNTMDGRYCGWGHIAPYCSRTFRCALCAREHRTEKHECPVETCSARVRTHHGQVCQLSGPTLRRR